MKKLAFGILLVVGGILLMSHNTSAFSLPVNNTADLTTAQFYRNNINGAAYWSEARQSWYSSNVYWVNNGIRAVRIIGNNDVIYLSAIRLTFDKDIPSYCSDGCYFSFSGSTNWAQGIKPESHSNAVFLDNLSTFYTTEASDNITQTNFIYWYYMTPAGYSAYNVRTIYIPVVSGFNYYPVNSDYNLCNAGNACAIGGISINFYDDMEADSDTVSSIEQEIKEQNQKEQEANENISNQTPSDISGDTDNQASTNLIGAFSSFVNALTNVQTGNCNITLAFPDYAGGSQTVNICQNKDKAGNLISVFSSLTLIVFYIPLAIRLLTMIYNEIRSFTNG